MPRPPKPWEEMVEEFPLLSDKELYRAVINEVSRQRSPAGIVVTLQLIDEPQMGREVIQVLPLPLRPTGLTASCFKAAGIHVAVGNTLRPDALLNRIVFVCFARNAAGEWAVTRFRSLTKETADEPVT